MNPCSRLRPLALIAAAVLLAPAFAFSQSAPQPPPATREEAIARGLEWLKAQQKPDGSWSDPRYPALTALPLWCFAQSEFPGREAILSKAAAFIVACAQEDGGLYRVLPGRGGGLSTYNTAIGLAALGALNDPAHAPVLLKARRFLAAAQHAGDDPNNGGMGYDAKSERPYSDLNNTVWAVEAMKRTEKWEDLRPAGTPKADLNWTALQDYLKRCQNTDAAGPDEAGGFSYRPDESKAGAATNAQGVLVFRSYGSMTYAGMLSLIYANVDRSDPRVKSAFDWSARHWTLEENPGVGSEGLYYFYNILAKTLAAYGRSEFGVKGQEKPVAWKKALTDKLLAVQQPGPVKGQGFWINAAGRWQEADPVLVTAYSILALQYAR